MSSMFADSEFNNNISNWNVTNVTNMSYMFFSSKFDGDISDWNINRVSKLNNFGTLCNIDINNINKYKVIISKINRRKQKLGLYKPLFILR